MCQKHTTDDVAFTRAESKFRLAFSEALKMADIAGSRAQRRALLRSTCAEPPARPI